MREVRYAMGTASRDWPVLTRYDREHLARVALPLGGIGTGTVSLGGRGDLRDWEIVNRAAKGFIPVLGQYGAPFFALYVQPAGASAVTRLIEGPQIENREEAISPVKAGAKHVTSVLQR